MLSNINFVTELLRSVYCPEEHTLLTNAVTLWPCCHKINQAAAERMYGQCVDGKLELGGRCTVCNKGVTGYAPDEDVRKQAALIFGNREQLGAFFGQPLDLEETPEPRDFPGKPGSFKTHENLFGLISGDRGIFDSTTPDSLIKEFIIMTKDDGQVGLTVRFQSGMKFEDYMRSRGVALWDGNLRPSYDETTTFHTSGQAQCQKLINILIENNQIEPDHAKILRNWVNGPKMKTTSEIVWDARPYGKY